MCQDKEVRVFVVDDEPVIASTLAIILKQSGFSVVSFTNPLEALRNFGVECPDLLITDVAMPEMSGIDLAISVRKQCAQCKILLFSGHAATAGLLDESQSQGYDFHWLSKPIHPIDLLKGIRTLTI